MTIERLDEAIKAVCPISGLSWIDESRHLIQICFLPAATPQQRAAAQQILDSIDWNAPDVQAQRYQQAATFLKNLPNPLNPDGSVAQNYTAAQITKSIWAIRRILGTLVQNEDNS